MNHLIDFGVCALVGCTNYIILYNYCQKIFQLHFGCSIKLDTKHLQKQAIFLLNITRYVVHTGAEINYISNKA